MNIDAYTAKDIAARLQVTESMVQQLVSRGDIPHVRFSKTVVRFPIVAFERWLIYEAARSMRRADPATSTSAPAAQKPHK